MSTNLRLSDNTVRALRAESERTGRSQQELMREAVDRYLGLTESSSARQRALASGRVRPPSEFHDMEPLIQLESGFDSLQLLDRDER